MPAGDLVVADNQWEIRTTLLGETTSYDLMPPGVGGLGNSVKPQDVNLTHGAGSYGGTDRKAPLVLTFPVEIATGSASTAGSAFKTLNDTTWALSTTDIPLYVRLAGIGKFYVNGRPRGVAADLSEAHFGFIRCLLTFVALDPTITYV